MGLFAAWFPVLILCSILDRNPVASDDIQRKLNKMVDLVCTSLEDDETRNKYISSFRDLPQSQQMTYWVEKITAKARYIREGYFCGFSGQARTRFHYGAAHAILVDIEKAYIAERGRNWLADPKDARASLVLGQVDHGFTWFDGRQLWQVIASIVIVGGTSVGAFVLSFNTPTVGLGCRTGGYLIFFVVAFALLLAEILVWWFTSPLRKHERFHTHLQDYTQRVTNGARNGTKRVSFLGLASSRTILAKILQIIEEFVVWSVLLCLRILPSRSTASRVRAAESLVRNHFDTLHSLTARNWLQRAFFTPLEFANMVWLCYLLMAQTIGAFNNCACMTSSWGGFGGYMDFTQFNQADSPRIAQYWIEGTIITILVMSIALTYIVLEVRFHSCS